MTRPLYSAQLSSGETALGAFVDLLVTEVPLGVIWVLRDIVFRVGPLQASSDWGMYVKPAASAVPVWLYTTGLPSNQIQVDTWEGRLVMEPGDQIRTQSEGSNPDAVTWLISGYVLTAP